MIIEENYSLKQLNTFGIDVTTAKLVTLENEIDIERCSDIVSSSNKIFILGSGSNILFTKDFDGTIIKCDLGGINELSKNAENVYLEVGSGIIWDDLVNYCVRKNFGGIENLSLIPGTVGAAPIQNIGAYGTELKNVFHELERINLQTGEKSIINREQCKFGYRDSIFKRNLKQNFLITKVILKLDLNPKIISSHVNVWDSLTEDEKKNNDIKRVREVVIGIRKFKLPDPNEIGNAGSFFKNPIINRKLLIDLERKYGTILFYEMGNKIKIPAGWLIEKAGFKGKRFGNVGVHKKQALVLVNYGNGTGEEILKLSKEIQQTVLDKFNIDLETEVNIV